MKDKVKIGFCVAYDWYLLEYALPPVYEAADIICLSLDINRTSWSGLTFAFDEKGFLDLVKRIDTQKKIVVLEESFYVPSLRPMQNEIRQRNRMAEVLGAGGWHIQLDCDEYFPDFGGFVNYLFSLPEKKSKDVNICCLWIVLYKQTKNGFLYVDPERKDNLYFIQIATRNPSYEHGRRNGNFNICTSFYLVHQSWARTENEIREKIANWGHSDDLDSAAYFEKWNAIDEDNYTRIRNFHPTTPEIFPSLVFEKGQTIPELLRNLPYSKMRSLSPIELFFRNSKWVSRLKKISKLFR